MSPIHRGRCALLALPLLFWGCGESTNVPEEEKTSKPDVDRGSEWVESSHGERPSDTTGAFPPAIRSMVIAMPDSTWTNMTQALHKVCGAMGGNGVCTGSQLDASPAVSAWRKGNLLADGQVWASVGFRFRSNSDLAETWTKGTNRYPFRLTMDKWEDDVPSIKNQRFYGFKKLTLTSLAGDSSALRHQVASAIYRSQGVPALQGAVVDLKLARGSDTLDLGLYALREVPDGPILSRWFADGSGNQYEPSSTLGTYVKGEFSEGENDGSHTDVIAFLAALNSNERTTNPDAWRNSLRKVFDVDGFVRWMAVSQALGDNGSYGRESGNYGLYGLKGTVHWMALDLDKTFPAGGSRTRGVWYPGTAGSWPLVEKILADSTLCEEYSRQLRAMVTTGDGSTERLGAFIRRFANSTNPAAEPRLASLFDFAAKRPGVVDSSLAAHPCPRKD
ncbi:MAG TPA: CotH kinase family protein [Fibrobacteria bacterium]|nr:CotH kinase family protein [Fibrobacteria bacterium]